MDIPETVRIQGVDWSIKCMDLEDNQNYGETVEISYQIRIDTRRPEARQRSCLLHELFHALEASLVPPGECLSETQIKRVSGALFQVLADNPDVAAFICGLEKPDKREPDADPQA